MSSEEAKKEATVEVRKAKTKKRRGEAKRKEKPGKKERKEKEKRTMKIYIKKSCCVRKATRERVSEKDGK